MELINNRYTIAGVDALELCDKYESPLYVYDSAKMREQYEKMMDAFKSTRLKINYACKALTNISVLKFFNKLGAGLDTVSIQEVWLGLGAGFEPKDIIYTPNCVSMEEINLAVKEGVKINIDNISTLEQFGLAYGDKYPICIRINPHIMAGGNDKISVGHIDSKFGISIHQMPHVERIVKSSHLRIEGLHMHSGSDILDVDVFMQGADILFEIIKKFDSVKYVDFGSGFKVAYKPDDYETDINQLGETLSERFNQFCKEIGKEITLMFEPGKYLVSEAGYLFAKVNVIKQTTSTMFAGLDTGMNHFIRPMFYDAYHQIINISKPDAKPRLYTVVGYICETDTFGWNRKINEISEGDILCFKNAGAYCYSMSSNYNSRFRPAEVMIHEGKDYLIRKREDINDILNKQLIIDL
ncbi:MAG: diaminopimelate decarboxylase [Ignavibacteriae bacterium]|nr:diaminopimelate decarboxylase [Ignavibacteriota bacterium]